MATDDAGALMTIIKSVEGSEPAGVPSAVQLSYSPAGSRLPAGYLG
jgi:hypothetical protein